MPINRLKKNSKPDLNHAASSFRISRYNILVVYISFLLIISFVGDGINAFLVFYQISFERASIFSRSLLEISIIFFFIFNFRISKRIGIIFLVIFSFGLIFTLGFGTYLLRNINSNIVQNVIFLNKMFFFPICFCFLLFLKQSRRAFNLDIIYRTYEIIILISGAAIIAGFLFHIPQFSSYGSIETGTFQALRFGYKGLINGVNEATVFWILALFYGLQKLKFERKKACFFLAIVCCLLMGTKGAWFFSLLTILMYFMTEHRSKALMLLFVVIFVGVLFNQYIVQVVVNAYNVLDIFEYFRGRQSVDVNALSILLSGRDNFITLKLLPNIANYWTPLNWLFGGQDRMMYLTEMDFLDMFQFFGIVGEIIYLSLYIYIFSIIKSSYKYIFLPIYFLLAFFNGHTFESALNAMYLAIIVIKASDLHKYQVQDNKFPTKD
jgi:hypothetical protein